jgi:hypothetical protein
MSSPIQGVNVVVKVSTDGTNYFDMICEINNNVDLSRATNSTRTKCDGGTTAKSLGAYEWSFGGSAVADNAPTGSQISYKSLLAHFIAGTYLYVKVVSPGTGSSAGSDFAHKGRAYLTALKLTNEVDGVSQFDFTFSGDGALTIV